MTKSLWTVTVDGTHRFLLNDPSFAEGYGGGAKSLWMVAVDGRCKVLSG